MGVLVDTSVWSLALRRAGRLSKREGRIVRELLELIDRAEAHIAGCIRQEVLSGISQPKQFEKLRAQLRSFVDLPTDTAIHERAAAFFNTCRARGVQGSHVDFLICALAAHHGLSIFTIDQNFERHAETFGLALHTLKE